MDFTYDRERAVKGGSHIFCYYTARQRRGRVIASAKLKATTTTGDANNTFTLFHNTKGLEVNTREVDEERDNQNTRQQ